LSIRCSLWLGHWNTFRSDDLSRIKKFVVFHQDFVLFFVWRFWCFDKWSLRMKAFLHTEQTCFFSPVCVRRWRLNSSDRANVLSHLGHEHENGLSPTKKKICSFLCHYNNRREAVLFLRTYNVTYQYANEYEPWDVMI
jgi:hypothetical protein